MEDRYVKLDSVGCWLDLKTGNTFPQDKNGKIVTKGFVAVHVRDCSYGWIESLKGMDKVYVGVWFKNN